jgi:hypothetical protein
MSGGHVGAARAIALVLALALPALAAAQALRPFTPSSLEQIEAAHRGKPFLLLVWSMDCEFCQASLALLAQARAAGMTVDVVTVSTDPAADRQLAGQSLQRLAELGLAADAWAFGPQASEQLAYAIDPRWHGEKPRSYWYDAAGRRSAHSGVLTPALLARYRNAH